MTHPSPCRICATRGHYSVRDVLEWPLAAAGVVILVWALVRNPARIAVSFGGGVKLRAQKAYR